MYQIEQKPAPWADNRCKYPFALMKVGDSIFVTGKKITSLLSYARQWCKKNGIKASWYAVEENNGVRLWRRK